MIVRGHRLGLIALAATLLFATGAVAQKNSPWKTLCKNPKKQTTCRIVQKLYLRKNIKGKQKVVGLVLGMTVLYIKNAKTKKRSPYMSVRMPLGVDLRPGAVMRIDKGPEIRLNYLQCTNAGCDASLPINAGLLRALKAGKTIHVGFRPWGQAKVAVVPASLKGFTRAFGRLR